MHPDPELEAFLQEYARLGVPHFATRAAGLDRNGFEADAMLRAPGAQARLAEIFVERGRRALRNPAAILGRLDALGERLFSQDPSAAAKVLAIQARAARDFAELDGTPRRPGRAATQFKPGPRKAVLVPGKRRAEAGDPAFDSEGESGAMVESGGFSQVLDAAQESGPTVESGNSSQTLDLARESASMVEAGNAPQPIDAVRESVS